MKVLEVVGVFLLSGLAIWCAGALVISLIKLANGDYRRPR